MKKNRAMLGAWMCAAAALSLGGSSVAGRTVAAAEASDPAALQAVRNAVEAELHANATDHSNWAYRDHDVTPSKNAVYDCIETPQGELRRMIEFDGQQVSPVQAQAETSRIVQFVRSPAEQAKARKNEAHDDAQAEELLKMLPTAFVWRMEREDSEAITLGFHPNPDFDPPDMQARVMGQMGGEMVISRQGSRIRTLRGALTEDVNIGWGLLGRLNQGGTFDVERRQVGSGHWQITQTHVHIGGRALLFKTIGQQEDEDKTEFHPSSAETLVEAARGLHAVS